MYKDGQVWLSGGGHGSRDEGVCAMEYAAYLAGEVHSDRPECVSRVLTNFMIMLNDSMNDKDRQRLKPYLVRCLGTHDDHQDAKRRDLGVVSLVRFSCPKLLHAAGLHTYAKAFEDLPDEEILNARRDKVGVFLQKVRERLIKFTSDDALAHCHSLAASMDLVMEQPHFPAIELTDIVHCAMTLATQRRSLYSLEAELIDDQLALLDRMLDPTGKHNIEGWICDTEAARKEEALSLLR